ncbi:hypothetical protein BX600DRAFT_163409 [Xylariales sp. PMI_506]|nr:hypothetical protein BX600DRAFT_163409 [Xylariales sp. PMI_506]
MPLLTLTFHIFNFLLSFLRHLNSKLVNLSQLVVRLRPQHLCRFILLKLDLGQSKQTTAVGEGAEVYRHRYTGVDLICIPRTGGRTNFQIDHDHSAGKQLSIVRVPGFTT